MVLLPPLPTAPSSLKISEDARRRHTSLPCSHSGPQSFPHPYRRIGNPLISEKDFAEKKTRLKPSASIHGHVVSSKWVDTVHEGCWGG